MPDSSEEVPKCAYCGKPITPGDEWYLDESGADGAFCCELHAEAQICRIVELIDNEDSADGKEGLQVA